MNSSILIVLIPALLVAAGYIFLLRYMGFAPGYPRLIVAMALFFGAIYWLSRKRTSKAKNNQQ
jgi:type III secretory pathway component EscV